MNPYDRVAYPNRPYPNTHPDHLAVVARLRGIDAAPVERARVLELGASEGGNLIPMALTLPRAEFTGIDLAAEPVERGRQVIRNLGLQNVRLLNIDLLDVDASFGKFDYVIAHGLYAWTPPKVRDKLLAIARENLNPAGVAFVSYNAYPGGHLRMLLREMMLYHAGGFEDPRERLEQARAVMQLVARGRPNADAFDAAVAAEAAEALARDDGSLYHDYLAENYEPAYFHQFIAHADRHGLQYLDEASVRDAANLKLSPEAVAVAAQAAGGDRIVEEQYLDLLRLRRFRQSLLCHAGAPVAARLQTERAVGMLAATSAAETAEGEFSHPNSVRIKTNHALTLMFLRRMIAGWPQEERVEADTAEMALQLFQNGMIELHTVPGVAVRAGEKPRASPLVRLQASRGDSSVSTLRHRALTIEGDPARRFIVLLDGTRDRTTLAREMDCSREEIDARLESLARRAVLLA